MPECSIASCHREVKSKGWCRAHYMRWYQTGDVKADIPLRLHNVDPKLRFLPKVNKDGPIHPALGACWVWLAHRDRNGYGFFQDADRRTVSAHRFSYETWVGPIPEGMEIDHLCRNRSCVNPEHLEAVTRKVNMERSGPAVKTHCKWGHPLSGENLSTADGFRRCITCSRRRSRESTRRRRALEKQSTN